MNSRVFEAQRLLRRANEINPESAALAIEAMHQLAEARIITSDALYYINQAIPSSNQSEVPA